jgi:hypothetical protein
VSPIIIGIAIAFGLVCGCFEITNTSIGWHIASGRWMLSENEVLDRDVLSFTAEGTGWIDHEWLFQVLAAALFDLGGAPALVGLRMLVVAALMVLLLHIGVRSGLDPPVALLLASLCVLAARPRFFVRPELATLLLLPLAMWLFADRRGRRWWPLPLGAVIVAGANLHGAILVAPILISVWFSGEILDQLIHRRPDRSALVSGATGVAAAFVAPMLNPHGPAIWTVPFTLAELVRQPHIPNPEWLSPGPADAPSLYLGLVLAGAVLLAGSRAPQSWLSLGATASLALKHIRNIGVFFVLLPQTTAPALARWPLFSRSESPDDPRRRPRLVACLALVALLGITAAVRPWPAMGFSFADRWYPDRAWSFLTEHDLLDGRLYNDVRFGGWLTLQERPLRQVFIDDRNEIHEALLAEIWAIFSRSDVGAWEDLLDHWRIDTVLLRYHEPIRVTTPDGRDLGRRGFSTLWFPAERWATVYWDDVGIVLVRRSTVNEDFLAAREYHHLHPDDLEHLVTRLGDDPELRAAVASELRRALDDDPLCRRARHLAADLGLLTGPG